MRLDPALKARLQALADADNRSLTNYVETVLQAHVRAVDDPKRDRKAA